MKDEWIVQVDDKDTLIGKVERYLAHEPGDLKLHREVMTLLYTDAQRNRFLLQHRSMKKRQLPGYWTLSVTGHVDYLDINENDPDGYLTAAKRETREEIGARTRNLVLVGKCEQKIAQNWSMMGIVVGEYEGELKLDPEEVSEIREFSRETLVEVSDKLTPGAKQCLEYLGILEN